MRQEFTTVSSGEVSMTAPPAPHQENARPHGAAHPWRLSLRVFAVLTLLYLCTWAGHYTSGDGAHKIAWSKAMLAGNLAGERPDHSGVYSKYGIGHSLIAIPPLVASSWIREVTGLRTEAALYTLLFVVNGAFFLALVAFYLGHFYPPPQVWATVLIIGFASTWWPYTKLDFSEPLLLTTLFLGFVLVRFGRSFLGLLVAGFTLTIRPDAIVILAPLVAWYVLANRSLRKVAELAVAIAPSAALVLFANYIRYHSFADSGYADQRFSTLFLTGLFGILLSSGKSIFLFSPPLLLGALGWRKFASRDEIARDAWLFLGMCVAQILFYAKYCYWTSDDAWGDRYLLPSVILMCIPMVSILYRRMLVIPVVAVGVFVQFLAVAAGGLEFLTLVRSTQPERHAVFMGRSGPLDFEDLWFNPNYSQIYGNWIFLRYLLHIPPETGKSDDPERVGTPLYEAIPPQAWRETAHWDFLWNLHRSAPAGQQSNPAIPSASSP